MATARETQRSGLAIYDDLGNAIKSSFAADITTTAGAQIEPAVTALANGGFIMAWNDVPSHTVKAQAFTATGTADGNKATIASLNDVRDPSLGTLTDGRFVVAVDNNSGADFDIEAAIWSVADDAGTPVVVTDCWGNAPPHLASMSCSGVLLV